MRESKKCEYSENIWQNLGVSLLLEVYACFESVYKDSVCFALFDGLSTSVTGMTWQYTSLGLNIHVLVLSSMLQLVWVSRGEFVKTWDLPFCTW
jgi:hypothetical protein